MTLIDRFWGKVDTSGDCWTWTGYKDRDGYGLVVVATGVTKRAHRVAFEMENGPLPKGAPLDHTCHNSLRCTAGVQCPHRACVRPSHLRVATPKENGQRTSKALQTHCKYGHPFDEANTYIKPNGCRQCRACHLINEAKPENRERRAEAARRYRTRKRQKRHGT